MNKMLPKQSSQQTPLQKPKNKIEKPSYCMNRAFK